MRRTPSILTPLSEFDLALAQGTLLGPCGNPGLRGYRFQGRHPGVDFVQHAIHPSAPAVTSFYLPSAADTYRIAAGNAADDSAGAGARTVELVGIDDTFQRVRETITLAGASPSADSTATFWRVFFAEVKTVGTYGGSNTGDVVIESTTGNNETLRILAGVGNSEAALIATGADASFVRNLTVHHEGLYSDPTAIAVFLRPNYDEADAATVRLDLFSGFTGTMQHPIPAQWVVPPRSDFWLETVLDTAATNTTPMKVSFDATFAPLYEVGP